MAAKLKVDQVESVDGSSNITINNSVTMAATKTLPAASLTGTLPAISAANLTAIPAANITGTLPAISGANLTAIPAANITGTLPAISGVNLTALNATNLGSGTVPTARLGSGTADSSVHLRGDGTWAAAGGGKLLQVVKDDNGGNTYIGGSHSSYTDTSLAVTLTTAGANSKFIISVGTGMHYTSGQDSYTNIRRNISGGANTSNIVPATYGLFHERITGWTNGSGEYVDSPSIAASTSVTYTVQIKNSGSVDWCHSAGYSYITVTEVGA